MSIAVDPSSVDLGPTATTGELTCSPGAGTGAWWVWECPCCGRSYEADLDACIEDGTSLHKVGFSLPFIWLG
jgi:hypothetical protein